MPLLGSAAMLLLFDVEAAVVEEHDQWHTQEHLRERLSIPGFLRGTRWVASAGGPRYMVLYEVSDLDVLASDPYLARLNQPTPWTAKMMPHYRGMRRGLCEVLGSAGWGQGEAAALLRYRAEPERQAELNNWILRDVLPRSGITPGLGSAHHLHAARQAAMTVEQRIRGADGSIDTAIIATGYDPAAVAQFTSELTAAGGLPARGATDMSSANYRLHYALAAAEVGR